MAIYFVNALGSQSANFTTKPTGANTLDYLVNNVSGGLQDGDIIEVTDDAEIDDSASSGSVLNMNITMRSHSANTGKPTIKVLNSGVNAIQLGAANSSFTIQNIKFYKAGPSADQKILHVFGPENHGTSEISGCEFWVANITGMNVTQGSHCGAISLTGNCTYTLLTLKNNKFYNLASGISWWIQSGP